MSEPATKADIEKMITLFGKRFDAIDQQLNRMDSKLNHTIEEVARLREDITGLQNEKFEIKRVK